MTRSQALTAAAAIDAATGQTLAAACVDAYLALRERGDADLADNGNPALVELLAAIEAALGGTITV